MPSNFFETPTKLWESISRFEINLQLSKIIVMANSEEDAQSMVLAKLNEVGYTDIEKITLIPLNISIPFARFV